MANRTWTIGIVVAILTVALIGSIGLYLFGRDSHSQSEIRDLIKAPYSHRRPGGGRLSAASYTSLRETSVSQNDLGRAQLLLLRQPDSPEHRRLQATVYLAAGEWQKFIDLANSTPAVLDAATLNNIGASFLALSDEDPAMLLKALDAFEHASKADRNAPEPLFNMTLIYRRLRLLKLAEESLRQYSVLDKGSEWLKELSNPERIDEASVLDQLEQAVARNDLVEAKRLFQMNPELCRRVAMQYALYDQEEPRPVLDFISAEMQGTYGDKTIAAMVAPLFTDKREITIRLRSTINSAAKLYTDGNYPESMSLYEDAERMLAGTDSVFDGLWLDLNKVDTQIHLAEFDEVRHTLTRLTEVASKHEFLWMNAKALSIYGSSLNLTSTYAELLSLLSKADHEFIRLDAPHDRIRDLYYLAAYQYFGGDQDEALRLSLECLRLIKETESVRISTLDWLVGSILYRRGLHDKSLLFATESVDQSRKETYANGIGLLAPITLAEIYQGMSDHEQAAEYLKIADEAFKKVPPGFDRTRFELMLGIAKAKSSMNRHEYGEAESLLKRNLTLYAEQPFPAIHLLSPSFMLLGQVYSETGRLKEAAHEFTEALDVVERNDEYLKSEVLRIKYDDARRDLYDSAIEFEFQSGSVDAAWTYLQRYRAKLFLEFLAAFNPSIGITRARLDRAEVQHRLPKDTQIVEYALLKDHLLIWVLSNNIFVMRSVPVKRMDIEEKVQLVLKKLRTEEEVDPLLTDLGKLLIDPVGDLLDPDRTLTIIPDRALHGLPFGALRRPGKATYLIQDFPIVVSPSLTYFLSGNGAQPPRNEITAFGSQTGSSSEFKELSALSGIYPMSATFMASQVDKPAFLAGLKKAAVFHYAGHSATDAADPLRSVILLDGNRGGPNSVTAVDISQQRLPNNAVVILSSCDSSVGNSRDGIGVRGLTSAFLIAGAGSVVGSLWRVEASSTADLMIRFHRTFATSGMPVAKALREAQLAFLKAFPDRAHPYYWSGFIVTGNFSALR